MNLFPEFPLDGYLRLQTQPMCYEWQPDSNILMSTRTRWITSSDFNAQSLVLRWASSLAYFASSILNCTFEWHRPERRLFLQSQHFHFSMHCFLYKITEPAEDYRIFSRKRYISVSSTGKIKCYSDSTTYFTMSVPMATEKQKGGHILT